MSRLSASELEYIDRAAMLPLKCRVVCIENSSPHWHYEYEVFFVLRGGVTVHAEGKAQQLGAGDIFLFNAREIHSINLPTPENLCLVLQFGADAFADVYKTTFKFELNTRSEIGVDSAAAELFRRDLAHIGLLLFDRPNGYQFFVKSRLLNFIGAMFQNLRYQVEHAESSPSDNRLEDFDAVKRYIKKRFAEEIRIEQMCRDLAISRAKLYRVLKEAGTESYKSIVNYYRVENAKELLRNTNSSISYISQASGFESVSSFYRVFKELTSLSPNSYRERPQAKDAPVGVQGYASYSVQQAVSVLRDYCAVAKK
ncbi:MAG: AraC family transcriptional regulator [Clostridiales bacterium]|jgi:AraC-like DNA-binding protein|nr:AraC family transcriptional regulator [Clostridiales bacterium]